MNARTRRVDSRVHSQSPVWNDHNSQMTAQISNRESPWFPYPCQFRSESSIRLRSPSEPSWTKCLIPEEIFWCFCKMTFVHPALNLQSLDSQLWQDPHPPPGFHTTYLAIIFEILNVLGNTTYCHLDANQSCCLSYLTRYTIRSVLRWADMLNRRNLKVGVLYMLISKFKYDILGCEFSIPNVNLIN